LFWINKQHLSGTAGYENYTSYQLLLLAEQDIQLLLLLGQAPFISEGYAVWIDYNQNGVFTDAGEQVWSKAASTINPVSGSLRFPPQQL
jgi:hypothetical protein